MARVRMTMVYEFDYLGVLDTEAADRLAENFYKDPTNFVHDLEWDEILLVDIQNLDEEVNDD